MNDYHPPVILLGPTFTRVKSLATLSDYFHEAATNCSTAVNHIEQHECDLDFVVDALASWYNEGVSPQHALSGKHGCLHERDSAVSHKYPAHVCRAKPERDEQPKYPRNTVSSPNRL